MYLKRRKFLLTPSKAPCYIPNSFCIGRPNGKEAQHFQHVHETMKLANGKQYGLSARTATLATAKWHRAVFRSTVVIPQNPMPIDLLPCISRFSQQDQIGRTGYRKERASQA